MSDQPVAERRTGLRALADTWRKSAADLLERWQMHSPAAALVTCADDLEAYLAGEASHALEASPQEDQKADGLLRTPGREESDAMRLQPPPDNATTRTWAYTNDRGDFWRDTWAVEVSRNGENILTISRDHLSGKPEFTEREEQIVRDAAQHLLSFIGAELILSTAKS